LRKYTSVIDATTSKVHVGGDVRVERIRRIEYPPWCHRYYHILEPFPSIAQGNKSKIVPLIMRMEAY
jgi:hypothetical protein